MATIYERRRATAASGLLGLAALVGATDKAGLATGSLGARLMPELRRITGVGLTSTRGAADATTQATVAVAH